MSAHMPPTGADPSMANRADPPDQAGELDAYESPLGDQPSSDQTLASDVAKALTRPRTSLRFATRLEARFRDDQAEMRVRRFRFWGLVAALMFNLFNLTDAVMLPDVVIEARWVRLGMVTPFVLLTSLLLPRAPLRQWREAVVSLNLLVVAGSVIYLFSRSLDRKSVV